MLDLLTIIALSLLIIATFTDIRWREIPDWISYSAITMGLGVRGILAIINADLNILVIGLAGLAVAFFIGVLLFYTGQWGGGDSKVLMGVGAIVGFEASLSNDFVAFLMNLIIVGGVFSIIWTKIAVIRNYKAVSKKIQVTYSDRKIWIPQLITILVAAITITYGLLSITEFYSKLGVVIISLTIPLLFFVFVTLRIIEKICFVKKIDVSKLTEGDWIAKNIIHQGKKICGPKDLGISKEQIKILKNYGIKKIRIKVGMPFIPSFLIAYILTLFLNNIFLLILGQTL